MGHDARPLDYLYGLELHGIKLGLDNITRLLAQAGDPHRRYPSVHVAGTNGKGSVLAVLDAILQASGYRCGRFTSPHLCSLGERFLIDSAPIAPERLDEEIEYFRGIAESSGLSPTFFELNTAIAFRHFAREGVDIGLIEVGMGGRFDSTNVLMPLCCAVTSIALEHTKYLGNTLEAIAFEKAGILKPGVPAVVGETKPGPGEVILNRAEELGCPVTTIETDFHFKLEGDPFEQRISYSSAGLTIGPTGLGLPGAYQGANAAVAIAIAERLRVEYSGVTEKTIVEGLAAARWPCRLERVLNDPVVILDVAHNAAGAGVLAAALDGASVVVLAVASDKDAAGIVDALAPKAQPLILTQFTGGRALPVARLAQCAGDHAYIRHPNLGEAIAAGVSMARERGHPLVVAGSLYTAGEARTILVDEYGAPPLRF